jgi:spoIIIJ-associated protein
MSRTIEITAKSEEEAKELVSFELNSNESIISSEVLSAPARGIFGLVGKPEFKIRFTIGEKAVAKEPAAPAKPRENIQDRPRAKKEDSERAPVRERSERPERPERSERRDRNDRPPRRREPREQVEFEMPDRPKEEVAEEVKNHPSYPLIFELIKEISEVVGVDGLELEDYQRDGAWVIEASGENVSQMIGKHGKTLDSLQYLMNIILNKGSDDRIKLVLDAQGYREKRYKNLISLAYRMSKKAVSSRRQVELEPMSTLDRRTIHMALKDKTDIETFSKGVEPMRRVVITPVKQKRTHVNSGWQPAPSEVIEQEREEAPTAVPMFMEEDV